MSGTLHRVIHWVIEGDFRHFEEGEDEEVCVWAGWDSSPELGLVVRSVVPGWHTLLYLRVLHGNLYSPS